MQNSQTLVYPHKDCTVGTALAFCGYATNEVDRDASTLSCSSRNAQAHNVHTDTHIHAHTYIHTHTHTHMRTHVHTHTHTHKHTHTKTHMHTNTHTHTLNIAPKQHAKLAQACSSRSSSDSNNSNDCMVLR